MEEIAMKYTVRRPIGSDRNLEGEGMIVSKHRTLTGARRSLARQRKGARAQGGYSQDYIWSEEYSAVVLDDYILEDAYAS
jgi:hypothetical protein